MSADPVLVSGATGFIGTALVRQLLDDGHDVHVLTRAEPAPHTIDARARVHSGCGSPEEVDAAVAACAPDVCIHLASLYLATHELGDIPGLIQSNVLLGTMLAESIVRHGGTRFITTGTAWQHFSCPPERFRSVNLYAATKTAFDHVLDWYADAHGLRAASVLLPDTYGAGDPRRKVVSLLIDAALQGDRMGMSPGDQLIDLVHLDDVVDAFRAALVALNELAPGSRRSWGVTSGGMVSLRDLVRHCEQATGLPIDVTFGERPYREREVMVPWVPDDIVPGWAPRVPLDAGLRSLVEAKRPEST